MPRTNTKKRGFKRCYETHPPLPIKTDKGAFEVFGGSCSDWVIKDADIYVGLDYSMPTMDKSFPWEKGHAIRYLITDMQAPNNPASFKKLIKWLAKQVLAGKKVHVGCIGGHGRTGTVLAALVAHMMGEEDAISYVRKHYCGKAVETSSQISFLHKHFGIKKLEGTKSFGKNWSSKTGDLFDSLNRGTSKFTGSTSYDPIKSKSVIW